MSRRGGAIAALLLSSVAMLWATNADAWLTNDNIGLGLRSFEVCDGSDHGCVQAAIKFAEDLQNNDAVRWKRLGPPAYLLGTVSALAFFALGLLMLGRSRFNPKHLSVVGGAAGIVAGLLGILMMGGSVDEIWDEVDNTVNIYSTSAGGVGYAGMLFISAYLVGLGVAWSVRKQGLEQGGSAPADTPSEPVEVPNEPVAIEVPPQQNTGARPLTTRLIVVAAIAGLIAGGLTYRVGWHGKSQDQRGCIELAESIARNPEASFSDATTWLWQDGPYPGQSAASAGLIIERMKTAAVQAQQADDDAFMDESISFTWSGVMDAVRHGGRECGQ